MSRLHLLRVVADRGDGTWILPASIDGLSAPVVPRLTFHDVLDDELEPWIKRFDAKPKRFREMSLPGWADFTVTTYLGNLFGTPVEIDVHRRTSR